MRHIYYYLIKSGISPEHIKPEYTNDKIFPYSIDLMIKPEHLAADANYKGIVCEMNGPSHYYAPQINGKFRPIPHT